nr:MFS transporter [Brevibacterium antiquum]
MYRIGAAVYSGRSSRCGFGADRGAAPRGKSSRRSWCGRDPCPGCRNCYYSIPRRSPAAFGTAAAIGLAACPVSSGGLVEALGWRGAFAVFAAGGLVLFIGSTVLPESRTDEPVPIDWIGAGPGILHARSCRCSRAGMGSSCAPAVCRALALSVISLALSTDRTQMPIIDFGPLRNLAFAGWLLALATVSIGYAGLLAHLPSLLQGVRALTPSRSGMILLAPVVPKLLLPIFVGHTDAKIPARFLLGPALPCRPWPLNWVWLQSVRHVH